MLFMDMEMIRKIMQEMTGSVVKLYEGGAADNYEILLVKKKPSDTIMPELHVKEDDIYYGVSGEATIFFSGELRGRRLVEGFEDQYVGDDIYGGESVLLKPGSFLQIPKGVPHAIQLSAGEFCYMVFKQR